MMFRTLALTLFAITPLALAHADEKAHTHDHDHGAAAQEEAAPVKVETVKLTDSIYMLQGGGGNIGLSVGPQGAFMIDDNIPDTDGPVMDAVKGVSNTPVRILVNTHWHYDHVGNNEAFSNSGATIMAHDNVRKRMVEGGTIAAFDKVVEPASEQAMPIVTFADEMTVHLNGELAQIHHVKKAHTDGDSFIYWPDSNIIHTGDVFFNGFYPFIDASSGGTLPGMIAAVEKILTVADDRTKIIPGHGPLANKKDLQAFRDFLSAVHLNVRTAKVNGKTVEEWKETNPMAEYEAEWGDGFLDTDAFTQIVWDATI